jgi:hypothetical protein
MWITRWTWVAGFSGWLEFYWGVLLLHKSWIEWVMDEKYTIWPINCGVVLQQSDDLISILLSKGMLLLLMALVLPQSHAYGPGFATEPPAQVLYSNLTGLVLDCLARGEPPPIVDWVDENGNVMALSPNFARYSELFASRILRFQNLGFNRK